jgi:HEAT repeat protein
VNPKTRAEVALAGHTGDLAVVREALSDVSAEIRATALTALHRLGSLTDDDVRFSLADPAPVVRKRAAHLAATRPGVVLLAALGDSEWSVAETAAWAVGEQGELVALDDKVFVALVAMATEHQEPLVREAAIASLGAIGDERGLPAILAGTYDKPAVRRRAIIALTPFDGPEVTEALERASTDRDWQVRDAATDLM